MTSTRYFIARIAQSFGYLRRSHRLGDAASEMHLLREAEAQLGAAIWENVEGIDALTVEYWNLRKLIKERDLIRAKLTACQERLDQAHEKRTLLLNSTPEIHQVLFDQRTALLTELEQLAHQRDQIVAEAREVRRTYIGHKMKLEVLTKEATESTPNQEQIHKVRTRLIELKTHFAELKQERIRIGESIEEFDVKVDLIDSKLKQMRQDRRIQASEAFQVIGEGNREISFMRAESGLLDTRMRQLYGEIGRYVSRQANRDPACAAAAAAQHSLVEVMQALRRSIALNHRLAGTS
jgi:chromosome segregation ATPase